MKKLLLSLSAAIIAALAALALPSPEASDGSGSEATSPAAIHPLEGVWYQLISNADAADRKGRAIELLTADHALVGSSTAEKDPKANRLWTYNSDVSNDHQWWRFEKGENGQYALVCKALPEGSVSPTPTNETNQGRWDYDANAKHYNFIIDDALRKKADDGNSIIAFKSDQASGVYVNEAASGQNYAINCWSDATDGHGGEWILAPERYPINEAYDKSTTKIDNTTHSGRYTSGVTLASDAWGTSEVTGLQDDSNDNLLYHNVTDTQLKAAPGETVTATIIYSQAGMAGFAYIDLDNDGFFIFDAPSSDNKALKEGQELAAYTNTRIDNNWYHSDGSSNTGNTSGNQVMSFKVPETPGTYKMRFCTEWAAINPLGGSGIASDGGSIIDIDLVVAEAPSAGFYPRTVADDALNTRTQDASQPRYTNALTLSSPSQGASTVEINQQTDNKIYHSLMDGNHGAFIAKAGETVAIEPTWSMNAMHSYVFVDLDGSGYFEVPETITDGRPNGEMLSYSYLGGTTKNSAGEIYAGDAAGATERRIAPAFTIPAETQPGIYRLRFNVDWANSNPAGRENIGGNGGLIADIPLLIVDGNSDPTVNLTGSATNGTATYESGNNLTLTPDYGYTVGTLSGTATISATAYGPEGENPSTLTASASFSGPTIPAALLVGGEVTIDVTDAFAQIPGHDGYTLVWNDEFNDAAGSHPDTQSKYKVTAKATSTWSKNISERPELAEMDGNGSLILTAKQFDEPYQGIQFNNRWETGAIETSPSFATKYGRIEARIKTNKNPGTFPAFWMMPMVNQAYVVENGKEVLKKGWPFGGEIDIFETVGSDVNHAYATVHGVWSKAPNYTGYSGNSAANVDQWNVYAVEWDESSLKFYMGSKLLHTVNKTDAKLEGSWPFDKEFYIILNQSIGGNANFTAGAWPGLPVDGTVYQTEVDWVRVYQKTDALKPTVTFVDENGNPLDEQPSTISAEPMRFAVATNVTVASATASSSDLIVTPVEGTKNQFTVALKNGYIPDGNDVTFNVNVVYPAGIEAESDPISLTPATVTVTWPKTTDDSDCSIDLSYYPSGEAVVSTADDEAPNNTATVIKGSTVRVDYSILATKSETHRITSYGQATNPQTTITKDGQTVDLTKSAVNAIPPKAYQLTDDVEFMATTEYMPLISWEATEGVKIAVTAANKAVTSGSRLLKGTQLTATFTPNTDLHYHLNSVNGNPLAEKTTARIERKITVGTDDITLSAETDQHVHVTIDQNKFFTIEAKVGDEVIEADDLLPLDTEVEFTVTPAEGYMILEVNGEPLEIPATEPVTGTVKVEDYHVHLSAVVDQDHATADIFPDNIHDDLIALEDDLEEGDRLEDHPIHFLPADAEIDGSLHTLVFHHNSAYSIVTLPASLHRENGNTTHEFVAVSENPEIAIGEVTIVKNAWKLQVTRLSNAGETKIHIVWREKASAQDARTSALTLAEETSALEPDETPLTTVLVKVMTPPAATLSVSHEVEELSYDLKRDDTINLSEITAMLIDEDGEFTDEDGNPVALPQNYATMWVSSDPAAVEITTDEEGNIIAKAIGTGNATLKAVVYDTLTDKIVEESEPIEVKIQSSGVIVGIDRINADLNSGEATVYDLSGRRITRVPAPGIYIINGIKTLVR